MMPHKFVNELTEVEIATLKSCVLYNKDGYCRMRAHGILLSSQKYSINEIAAIYNVDRDTVSIWINKWESYGLAGLYNLDRSGRPLKINQVEQEFILEVIKQEPRSVKHVAASVKDKFGKSVSVGTIRRFIKRAKKVWKRVRTSLTSKRNPEEFSKVKAELKELEFQHKAGLIDLYYFDESGFSLHPVIPYAWQDKNNWIELPTTISTRINVLGFINTKSNLNSFMFKGKINAETVVNCIDDFKLTITKPTWLIMDNASIHTSAKLKNKIPQWEEHGLYLNYLPAYSPELNIIEILWRFIKYHWLPFSAYLSPTNLYDELAEVLRNVGDKYRINFV
jgi:transposase